MWGKYGQGTSYDLVRLLTPAHSRRVESIQARARLTGSRVSRPDVAVASALAYRDVRIQILHKSIGSRHSLATLQRTQMDVGSRLWVHHTRRTSDTRSPSIAETLGPLIDRLAAIAAAPGEAVCVEKCFMSRFASGGQIIS